MAGGHPNVYLYCANDPVNATDPSGLRDLTDEEIGLLRKLYRYRGDVPLSDINGAINAIKAAVDAIPNGATDPAGVKAIFWALGELGSSRWGQSGVIQTYLGTRPSDSNKCNLFVAEAYATGAGIGYEDSIRRHGVPFRGGRRGLYPTSANNLGNSRARVNNFPVVNAPEIGSIVAFANLDPGPLNLGHVTLWCGNNVLIYAGGESAKIGTFVKNQRGKQPAVFRSYQPFKF